MAEFSLGKWNMLHLLGWGRHGEHSIANIVPWWQACLTDVLPSIEASHVLSIAPPKDNEVLLCTRTEEEIIAAVNLSPEQEKRHA